MLDTIKENIKEFTYQYFFEHIFGYIRSQLRSNTQLVPIAKNAVNVYMDLTHATKLPLPAEPFDLYIVNDYNLQKIVQTNKWIHLAKVLDTYRANIDVYDRLGYMLPKRGVYIKGAKDSANWTYYIAIPSKYKRYIPYQDPLYLTFYLDTTIENQRQSFAYIPFLTLDNTYNLNVEALVNKILNEEDKNLIVYINGKFLFDPKNNLNKLSSNACIEVIIDKNIALNTTIPSDHIFNDPVTSTNYYLLHIPKDLNPKQELISYHLTHIWLFNKDTQLGLKIPYIKDLDVIKQITHQDLALDAQPVNAIINELGEGNYEFYLVYQKFNTTQTLLPNADFTKFLYDYYNNEEIIQILTGNYPGLEFLQASHLMHNNYINAVTYISSLEDKDLVMDLTVKALGYYNYINLIAPSPVYFSIQNPSSALLLNKPKIYANSYLMPIIYKNGKKLPNTDYTIEDKGNYLKINHEFQPNDKVAIRFKLFNLPDYILDFTPTKGHATLTLPQGLEVIDIYKQVKLTYTVQGFKESFQYYYTKLTPNQDYIIENNIVYFNSSTFDSKCFIVPKYFTKTLTFNFDVTNNDTIYFLLGIESDGVLVPLLNAESFEVYLNGYRLIEDIDYKIVYLYPTEADKDKLVAIYLILQNLDYLQYTNNKLEIIFSSYRESNTEYGVIIDNKGSINRDNFLWFKNLSYMFINGKILDASKVQYSYKDYFEVTEPIANGSWYYIQSFVPKFLDELVKEKINSEWFENYNTLLQLLANKYPSPTLPELIIVDDYKKIYSVFTNEIINYYLQVEPSTLPYPITEEVLTNIEKTFYRYKKYDVVFTNPNLLTDYLDIYPGIMKDIEDPSPTKVIFIRTLVGNYLKDIETRTDYKLPYKPE